MRDLTEVLEASKPFPEGAAGDWNAVLADARRRRARRIGPAFGLAAAVAAAALLALLWPFDGGRPGGILDRALAAAGDGPVVHLVVREGWGGTVVDLESGARTRLSAERELWYDPSRGLHEVARLGGQTIVNVEHRPGAVPTMAVREFAYLARDYRSALRSGRARVVSSGELEGIPVHWIRFETRQYPDVADGKLHELADDIAISQDDYSPVGIRETLDGKDQPDGPSRILGYETLPAGAGDFTAPPPSTGDSGTAYRFGARQALTPSAAAQVLPAVWDGQSLGDLPLARISRLQWAEHRMGAPGWTNQVDGVRVEYGRGSPAISPVAGIQGQPDGPYVVVDEFPANAPEAAFRIGGYQPPAGRLFLQGTRGTAVLGGVAVSIVATSPELVVLAARSLEPIPSG